MANKTFNIYCDESTHLINDHHPYMLYGYVSVAYNQIKTTKEQIKKIKSKFHYTSELKWTNVHEATFMMYKELIDYFFSTDISFRAVIVNKSCIIDTPIHENDIYFKMYYQLLHEEINSEANYNIYFDTKDTCSSRKLGELKKILACSNSSIRNFQFIKSHESYFMQLTDILMGAINYNLRIKSGDIKGNVIAKRQLADHICSYANKSLEQDIPEFDKKIDLFFISLTKEHAI